MNTILVAALASLTLIAAPLLPQALDASSSGSGQHMPADKTSVAASSIEVMSVPVVDGATSETVTLLGTTMRTSTPTDLVISVTAECALWTDVKVVGNDDSSAVASVKVWIEFDGQTIAVSDDEASGPDQGKVVFCNRAFRMVTTNVDDEDQTIQTFLRSRASNGFNWVVLNTGNGIHTIEVKANLEAESTGGGTAKAAVGKRTLVVEPVKLVNDATLGSGAH